MFIKTLKKLLQERGLTKNKFLLDLKLGKNSFNNWEQRGNIPNGETLQKIADYFDVTVDYLLGKTEEKKPLAECEGLTEQEQALINYFRSTSEQGKMKIIQNVMNICDEIEKKDTASNTKHSS